MNKANHEYHKDELLTLAAASRSSFCFCSKDSMDSGSVPGAIVAALEGFVGANRRLGEKSVLRKT